MRNFIQQGECIDYTAPTGGVVAGNGYLIGGTQFVVATTTAAAGAKFAGCLMGVFALTKSGSQGWAEGQKIYWDVANSRCDSNPAVGPFIGCATEVVANGAGDTTGKVCLLGCAPSADVLHLRKRVAVADVNAGATLVPAVPGRKPRLIDVATIAVGGAASAAFNILATLTAERKLVSQAAVQSAQSALLRAGATGSTLLADGASFTANDANTAITIKKDAGDVGTATSIDVLLTFALDAA
jgi:predicted RecA/RadA family phage recombinase